MYSSSIFGTEQWTVAGGGVSGSTVASNKSINARNCHISLHFIYLNFINSSAGLNEFQWHLIEHLTLLLRDAARLSIYTVSSIVCECA